MKREDWQLRTLYVCKECCIVYDKQMELCPLCIKGKLQAQERYVNVVEPERYPELFDSVDEAMRYYVRSSGSNASNTK